MNFKAINVADIRVILVDIFYSNIIQLLPSSYIISLFHFNAFHYNLVIIHKAINVTVVFFTLFRVSRQQILVKVCRAGVWVLIIDFKFKMEKKKYSTQHGK